ncbi:MAG TPA: hypothetical protein VG448_06440 [Solirubrobacterales bacterium]|nr:hypothetical protein [Solirubrobacterales bacterium]
MGSEPEKGGDAVSYGELISDFLEAHTCMEELGGFAAYDGVFVGDDRGGGKVTVEKRLMVFVSAVLFKPPEAGSSVEEVPGLWFVLGEAGSFRSFVVQTAFVIEQVGWSDEPLPPTAVPAYEARDPDDGIVQAGELVHIHIRRVQTEPGPGLLQPDLPPGGGIQFEVGVGEDGDAVPFYRFTMAGITPFLALSVRMARSSDCPSFEGELRELTNDESRGEDQPDDEA